MRYSEVLCNIRSLLREVERKGPAWVELAMCVLQAELVVLHHPNLEDHKNNISFDTLPKVFQDAITVVTAVGIHFIWIDSLCRVQNDKLDWLAESSVMGSIYEGAHLTITASAADDPTQGCFRAIKPPPHVIEVPYYSGAAARHGLIRIAAILRHSSSPYW